MAVMLSIGGFFVLGPRVGASDRIITTGANQSITMRLPDGGKLSLGARSTVRMNKDQQRTARLVEGEAMFEVVPDSARPYTVETFLVDVTTAGARFRIKSDSSVEIEVYDGVVHVSERAKAGAPVIILRKGSPYRVPVGSGVAAAANLLNSRGCPGTFHPV
ncbi:MAG: FecR family protein [Steroidobacteraceae bacterium]